VEKDGMGVAHLGSGRAWPVWALLLCSAACAAEVPPAEPGPWVELTLKETAEKIAGFLVETRAGTLALVPEKDRGTPKEYEAVKVESLNFDRPAPPAKVEPAKTDTPKKDWRRDDPTKDGERPMPGDRLKHSREMFRKRALERLTPEERKRFEDLFDRLLDSRENRKEMPAAEEEELRRLYEKLDLPDPVEVHQQAVTALKEARWSQNLNTLDRFLQVHTEKLRGATTDDERRRHTFGLFAGHFVQNAPPEKFMPQIAEALRQSDAKAHEKPLEKVVEGLRELYDNVFLIEIKRPDDAVRRPLFPLRRPGAMGQPPEKTPLK
jgi:hypothetical protein